MPGCVHRCGRRRAHTGVPGGRHLFGELALLHGSPRAASVQASTACVLWALDRRAFRALVTAHNLSSKHGIVQVLSQIPALRDPEMREEQVQALAGTHSP